jgi:hypothetical protein
LKKLFVGIFSGLSIAILFGQTAFASSIYATGSTGVDVSYPNCSASIPSVNFGIVGVSNGIVYGHNSCLASEAKHFSNLSLYLNTGLNTSTSSAYYAQAQSGCNGDANCAAYNYGVNAAKDALSYASSQGVTATKWWLDVETSNTWNASSLLNQQSLQGEYDTLSRSGAAIVGVYSTTAQWQSITGGWQNSWYSWGATTWTTASQAQTYCTGHQFTNGPSLLMQYKSKQSKIDQDVAC